MAKRSLADLVVIEDILDGEKALDVKRDTAGEYITWEEAEAMAAPLRAQRQNAQG